MLIKIQKRNCLELINIDKKPPSCIDCEYMKHDKEYWCRAKGISSAFSLITGKQIGIVNSCQSQRGGQGKYYCGIEGKFFKKKIKFKRKRIMSKLTIVSGSKNKPSGVISKLHSMFIKSNKFQHIRVCNGIKPPKDVNDADLLLWFPDINNEKPKNYPIKGKGAVLICSKVMREDTTRVDAVTRIFKMHGNAVVTIRKIYDSPPDRKGTSISWLKPLFEFELIDALNNTWIRTTNLEDLKSVILNFYGWTKNSIRKSLIHVEMPDNWWSPLSSERIDKFMNINRKLALKVAVGCKNRYFGNFSTRCTKLFPSKKISSTIFAFSPRNVDKRSVTSKDLVLTSFNEYYGNRKPSVDAPVQLEIYRKFPKINFMIHGHAHIKGAVTTDHYRPCGCMLEAGYVTNILNKRATSRINLRNHGFLLLGKTVDDFQKHLNECEFEMI